MVRSLENSIQVLGREIIITEERVNKSEKGNKENNDTPGYRQAVPP
jgi:hypothetical protein